MVLYSNGHIAMFVHFFERSKTNQFVRVLWLLNRDVLKFRWKHSDGKKCRSTKSIIFSIWDMLMQNLTRTKKKVGRAEKGIHWERRDLLAGSRFTASLFSTEVSESEYIFVVFNVLFVFATDVMTWEHLSEFSRQSSSKLQSSLWRTELTGCMTGKFEVNLQLKS